MYYSSRRNGGNYQGLTSEHVADSLQTRDNKIERRSRQIISYEHYLTLNMVGEGVVDLTGDGVIWEGFLPHEHHDYNGETRAKIGLLAHLQIYLDLARRELKKGYLVNNGCSVQYTRLVKPYTYADFLELLKKIDVTNGMQFKDCLKKLVAACKKEGISCK